MNRNTGCIFLFIFAKTDSIYNKKSIDRYLLMYYIKLKKEKDGEIVE